MVGRIFRMLLPGSFIILLLTACGGSGGSESSVPADTAAGVSAGTDASGGSAPAASFSLTTQSPDADAINRSLVTIVDLTFNQVLISSTVSSATIYVEKAGVRQDADIAHTSGTTRVKLSFPQPLLPSTRYTVVISSELMAEDGSTFVTQRWDFETAADIGATTQAVIDQCMSQADIDMLAAVNQARMQARSCGSSSAPAVATVAWDCKLEQAAQGHSQDMANNGFFDHTGSNGLGPGDRVTNAGYNWRSVSENIAAGQTSIAQVMSGWLVSPGHCSNIMSGSVTQLGASRVSSTTARYSDYWTQNFARPG
jgi:uncharacterized protein YkwD